MKFFCLFLIMTFCTSCYTLEQSYEQVKLLLTAEQLSTAIEKNKDIPSRAQKLNLVEPVLNYAQTAIGLTPKESYKKFVELKSPYVVWVVQASCKRSLKLKTWWFPFVGKQPYLGFFNKENAAIEQMKLKSENYDVSLGGVKAFSLLGYFDDPLYSSMLDNVTVPTFIETLIHETVHRTIYVKGDYAFNENLANFIARKATANFLKIHPEVGVSSENYIEQFKKNLIAQQKFHDFTMQTKKNLDKFYAEINADQHYKDESEFLKIRQNKFDSISNDYLLFMNGTEKNTNYEFAFSKGKFNNAVLLSYAVYEEDQKPLEDIFVKSNSDLKVMVNKMKRCLDKNGGGDKKVWSFLSTCFNGS
ncbi:MAG: aminopeptidase [Bdellovibrionota bacterium]